MSQPVHLIELPLPLGMGSVNCYVLQAGDDHILIDTGAPKARDVLKRRLHSLGCRPGRLSLIVLTHGDFDHTGNAASIRDAYSAKIGMHPADARMAETGDMFANRRKSNPVLRALVPKLIGFGESERFTPDVQLQEGASLSEYGLDARVISIPGHSRGSIGILTSDGDLFCGDLIDNTQGPRLNSIIDDRQVALDSARRLGSLSIRMVYPGHGRPFSVDQLPRAFDELDDKGD